MFRSCLNSFALGLSCFAVAAFGAEQADYILSARWVLTMDAQRRVIENGAVAVRADRIADVGPRSDIERRFSAKQRIHDPTGIITPGLINTHTHAPMVLMRGIADDVKLQDWLE